MWPEKSPSILMKAEGQHGYVTKMIQSLKLQVSPRGCRVFEISDGEKDVDMNENVLTLLVL